MALPTNHSVSNNTDSSVNGEFDALVCEISEKIDSGARVELSEYEEQRPEFADRLRRIWPTLLAMADLGHLNNQEDEADSTANPNVGILGDFQIIREVGRGGMGVVYEATQLSLGRRVALKVLPFASVMDKRQLQRFKNEAMAAAALDHPNIVSVFATGCERSVHFYAMHYVEGRTLAEVIAQLRATAGRNESGRSSKAAVEPTIEFRPGAGPAERVAPSASPSVETKKELQAAISTEGSFRTRDYFRSVAEIGKQAAEALDYAHGVGIVHRDVKPSNLILDDSGRCWVTDFGLAMVESSPNLTMTGDLLGTLRYMSPEQSLAKRVVVDHRTDVYSLGVTLYEMLTLQPAHTGDDRHELLRRLAFEEPTAPRKLNSKIPEDLETIVLKAMAKNPAERFATAGELAEDLQRFLDDKPILARRPTLLQRITKWSLRNKPLVAAAATLFLLAMVVLAVSNMIIAEQRNKAFEQRELAETAKRKATSEAERSRQIAQFMKDMLVGVGPGVAVGRDTTLLREILDQTAVRISHELENQPDVEADLRETLGVVYGDLGEYESAETMLTRALALNRQIYGESNLAVARVLQHLGDVYWKNNQNTEAESTYRQALALRREHLGAEHADIADSLFGLANTLRRNKATYEEAETMFRESLAIRRKLLGDQHIDVAETLVWLGVLLRSHSEKLDEAEAITRKALEIRRKALGKGHPHVAIALRELGYLLTSRRNDPAAGEPYLRESLAIQRKVLGSHRETLFTLRFLADTVQALDEREALLREALTMNEEIWGHDLKGQRGRIASDLLKVLKEKNDDAKLQVFLSEFEPTSAAGFVARAQAYQQVGATNNALDDYRNATELDTTHFDAWRQQGFILEELEDYTAAQVALERALSLNNSNELTLEAYGRVLARVAGIEEVLAQGKRIYATDQSVVNALRIFRRLDANGEYESFKGEIFAFAESVVTSKSTAADYYARAQLYQRHEEYELAIPDFLKAIELDPEEPRYWNPGDFCLGDAYYQVNRYEEALATYSKGIDHYPESWWGYFSRAWALYQLERFEEAVDDFTRAIEINPTDFYNWGGEELSRADAYLKLGMNEEALADRTKAVELFPEFPFAPQKRAHLFCKFARWDEALSDFQRVRQLLPQDPYFLYKQALIHIAAKHDGESYRKLCTKLLELQETSDYEHRAYYLCWSCSLASAALDDLGPVVAVAVKDVENHPDDLRRLNNLGAVLCRAGHLDKALDVLTRVETLARSKEDSTYSLGYNCYFMAMVQYRLGDAKTANQWLNRANEIADAELSNADKPLSWYRKLTFELFRSEVEEMLWESNKK